jgi:hypothetical protein
MDNKLTYTLMGFLLEKLGGEITITQQDFYKFTIKDYVIGSIKTVEGSIILNLKNN